MSRLILRYHRDPYDSYNPLGADVETPRFRGRGGMEVPWQDLQDFAAALAAYPIPAGTSVESHWGFRKCEGDDLILLIEITPLNLRGDLRARVEIADQDNPSQRLRAAFKTNYSAIDRFRKQLLAMAEGEAFEAELGED